jgi:hypothetical protein
MAKSKKTQKYEPPKAETGDTAHLVTSAILSVIPGAAELFEYFVTPPIEKRREIWMKEIGEGLRELEENKGVNLEKLQANDAFIDTLLHASQLMVRNSQVEKREALKNAVLNVALPNPPDQSLVQMFLECIDIFTVWHLKILDLVDSPKKWVKETDDQPEKIDMGSLREQYLKEGFSGGPPPSQTEAFRLFIEAAYPELRGRKEFYLQIGRDLYNHGLINIGDLESITLEDLLKKRSTELGEEFQKFIMRPL